MMRSHKVDSDKAAINLALQPGITGTMSRIGGNEFNAGAGLFFTKSIATLSRNRFFLYSGDSMFRLMLTRKRRHPALQTNPAHDPPHICKLTSLARNGSGDRSEHRARGRILATA